MPIIIFSYFQSVRQSINDNMTGMPLNGSVPDKVKGSPLHKDKDNNKATSNYLRRPACIHAGTVTCM